ncbi:hypothetical protein [Thiohalocapsa halophila]|nr:hypothetical protein [Thiohalocapsa halophila]
MPVVDQTNNSQRTDLADHDQEEQDPVATEHHGGLSSCVPDRRTSRRPSAPGCDPLGVPLRAATFMLFGWGIQMTDLPTPTLLIVAGLDPQAVDINRRATGAIPGESRLEIVPGATRLFEEAGRLDNVGLLARDWFRSHFAGTDESGEQAR